MRKKLFTNIVAIASVIAMTFALCSCSAKEKTTNPAGDETSDTTTEKETPEPFTYSDKVNAVYLDTIYGEWTPIGETESKVVKVDAGTVSSLNDAGFCLLNDVVYACEYTVESVECSRTRTIGDDTYTDTSMTKTYKCQYPLSGEQDDSITIWGSDYPMPESYIEINGVKKELSIDRLEGMAIVDIDERDSYKEIALLDDGPSGDPNVVFIRYVDGKIYEFGHFSSTYSGQIFTDRSGKIVSCYNCIPFIQPLVIYRYAEIIDNEVVYTDADYSDALNKEYTAFKTEYGHFLETDDQTLSHDLFDYSDEHDHLEIKIGDKIKIIKADIEEEIYYVELSDGRRGVFATRNCAG